MSGYSKILAGMCLADLLLTAFSLKFNLATEANPFMLFYFNNFGLAGFVVGKLFLSALSIFALETAFRFRLIPEKKMRVYYATAIFAFLAVYFSGVIAVNVFLI